MSLKISFENRIKVCYIADLKIKSNQNSIYYMHAKEIYESP